MASGRARVPQAAVGAEAGLSLADFSPQKDIRSHDRQTRVKTFNKTALCSFFARGSCSRGEDCNFAHGMEEMRAKPNLMKTRLCEEFKHAGTCSTGSDCSFAHGTSELRRMRQKQSRAKGVEMLAKEPRPLHAAKRLAASCQTAPLPDPDDTAPLKGPAAPSLTGPDQICDEFSDDLPSMSLCTATADWLVVSALVKRDVMLHVFMPAPSREEKDEDKEMENGEKALKWDPLCLGQLPALDVRTQLEHQESHWAEVVTVKNTFIHIQCDAPLPNLRRSNSSPACFGPVAHHEGVDQ